MTPLYTLDSLTKRYGTRSVLQIEQLTISQGEVLTVVGPSGAGKSTLLRLLNFLEEPTAGHLTFQGTPFSAVDTMPLPQRRAVTTVFQRPMLLQRSVLANVQYGLQLRGERATKERAMQALAIVHLTELAHQPAHTLSGGEAQRVALARALVVDPAVLLLDEPTANLDPHNVRVIEEAVQQRNRETGCTVVLVTHNLFQARRLADRVLLLLDGQIIEIAHTEQFFDSPSDPRTAAFVHGEMVY